MCFLCAVERPLAYLPSSPGPQAAAPPSITLAQGISAVMTDFYWGSSTLSYSIAVAGSAWSGYSAGGAYDEPFRPDYATFSTAQAVYVRTAMQRFDELIAVSFTESNGFANTGDIRFALTGTQSANNAEAYAYFPAFQGGAASPTDGDVWYSQTKVGASFAPGGFEFQILMHEIGHAMGLKHAHDTPNPLPAGYDSSRYSVMTYNLQLDSTVVRFSGPANAISGEYGESRMITLGLYDVAYLQQRYGADTATRSGATTYTFNASSSDLQVIYDSGGVDTFDLAGQTRRSEVDLREGAFSSINLFTQAEQIATAVAFYGEFYRGYVESFFTGLSTGTLFEWRDNVGIAFGTVIENVIFGSGNDSGIGNAAANTLDGRGGNDTLTGGAGNDTFVYTSGADVVTDFVPGGIDDRIDLRGFASLTSLSQVLALGAQSGANVVLTFSAGNTLTLNSVALGALTAADFQFTGGGSVIDGSAGSDNLMGTASADTINGLAGADTINGLGGADSMSGGDGSDIYYVDDAGDVVSETNAVVATGGYDIVVATANVTLSDNVEQLVIQGGATAGTGGSTANYLYGGNSGLSLTLDGGGGDDVIYSGLAGGNTVSGGSGVDTLLLHGGNNRANGGLGSDIYYTYTSTDVLSETGGDGIDTVFATYAITLGAGFEQLLLSGAASGATGSADNNIIYGNSTSGAVSIQGLGGADVIFGGGFNDTLEGGDGVDLLFGLGGANTLAGGADTDVYYLQTAGNTVTEDAGGGFDTIYSNFAGVTTLAANVEQLILYGAATGGTGTAGNDYLYANSATGPVTLDGGGGADYLLGSAQSDVLIGGAGNDQIDLATGGADRVRYNTGVNMGADTVYNFDAVGNDLIDLSGQGYLAGSIGGAITVATFAGGTLVTFVSGNLAGTTINLVGVAVGNVTAADFAF
jgi:serralysin